MNENIKWVAAAVGVVGLAIVAVVFRDSWWKDRTATPPETAQTAPPPAAPAEPEIKHPLPGDVAETPLPPLDGSDAAIQNVLIGLLGAKAVEQFLMPEQIVRHIVVTIDNLPEQKVAERLRPLKRTPGRFTVSGSEDEPVLDPANYERYAPLVSLLQTVDTKLLVDAYVRHYPLFQEAYESLGHPPEYFNDRLIEVIDHLLATPDLEGPIALSQPGVQYQFADAELEQRSAGQKVLLRMGSANAAVVKSKLRELRSAILEQKPGN
jgi:hypothetical protein